MNIPDYTLVQSCGRGAYGEVWLATNKTGKRVALKYLANSQASKKELAGLVNFSLLPESKHLIRVLHMGETEDGFFYTMELADCLYVQGQMIPVTLAQKLKEKKIFSLEETVELGLAMLDALKILHNAGLIHRDVKPENILYVDGVPKLSDVGLVRSITQTLSVGGTIGFIPPERLNPGNTSPSEMTDDLYALGKVLYCAATGNKVDDFPSFPAELIKNPGYKCINKVILNACDPKRNGFQTADDFAKEFTTVR